MLSELGTNIEKKKKELGSDIEKKNKVRFYFNMLYNS